MPRVRQIAISGLLIAVGILWLIQSLKPAPPAGDAGIGSAQKRPSTAREIESPPPVPLPQEPAAPGGSAEDCLPELLALAQKSPREQMASLQELLPSLAAPELLRALQALTQSGKGEAIQIALLGRLAELDGAKALAWLDQSNCDFESTQVSIVLNALPQPRLALDWLEAKPDSPSRNALLAVALGRCAQLYPREALRYALEEPRAELRPGFLDQVISTAARSDPAQGFEWACQYQSEARNPDLIKLTAFGWAAKDHAAASKRILNGNLNQPERDAAIAGLVEYSLPGDLAHAFDLIAQMSRGHQEYYRQAAAAWMQSDPGAALRWIARTPELSEGDRQALLSVPAAGARKN